MAIHEAAVTLTDLLLAAENAVLALLLQAEARQRSLLQKAFSAFFIALALAAAAGAVYHGWIFRGLILDRFVWRLTLFAIIAASAMAWIAAGHLLHSRWAHLAGLLTLLVGLAIVVSNLRGWANTFGVAIAFYLPAAMALLVAFAKVRAWAGFAGLVLTFVASEVQQSALVLGPLDHNALYHIIEGLALLLIFFSARRLVRLQPTSAINQ